MNLSLQYFNLIKMNWTLIFSILIFYGILIVVNIPAPFIGLEFEDGSKPKLWYQPPGFVIPVIWFILFALLGIARYILFQMDCRNCKGGCLPWLCCVRRMRITRWVSPS